MINNFNGPIQNIQLIAPGTYNATQTCPVQVNSCYKGIILYLNVTAVSGTGGLTPSLMAIDPLSGATVAVAALGSAKTSANLYMYAVYPATGMAVVDGGVIDYPLPSNWAIKIAAGDSSNYTYSLSADLIP